MSLETCVKYTVKYTVKIGSLIDSLLYVFTCQL